MCYEIPKNEELENEAAINDKIGKWLKSLRENENMSQEKLADMLGVDRRTIINYEKGRTMIPAYFLYKCARTFGVSASYILGNDSDVISKKLVKDFIDNH